MPDLVEQSQSSAQSEGLGFHSVWTELRNSLRPLPNSSSSYIFAVFCVLVAICLRMVLGPFVSSAVPFATLFPAIIITTLVGGLGPGMLALILGGFLSWLFVLQPDLQFSFPSIPDTMSLLLYLISGSLILVIVEDRRAAEHALREERDRAQLYFETAGVLLLVIGTDRKVRLINRAGAQMLGAPAEAIIGKDWVETFIPPRLHAKATILFDRCLREEEGADAAECAEGVVLHRNGCERVISWRNTLLRDGDGRIIGVLSSGEDVTDGRRAEQNVRESEARFRALAESMPQLVWSTRADGHCDYLSRQWTEYTGVTEAEHQGSGWLNAVHPDDRPATAAAWEQATQSNAAYDVRYRLQRYDGVYRWFAARGCPVTNEQGRILRWFGTSTDVTEIVEARQALEERVAERTLELQESHRQLLTEAAEREKVETALARAQRMEAIGQLTGGVAHDFNNLLTVVVGNLDMIIRSADDPSRVRRLATTAMSAADRGESVTRQLLAFSRQQTLKPEIVEINRLLGNFMSFARRAAGEAIDLRISVWPTKLYCRIDPSQFETALLNLVVNARDATAPGGKVVIGAMARAIRNAGPDDPPEIPSGEYAVISVTDTGSGIAAAVLPRVFEPFFTTKDVGKGSGLGLSQVYGFVRQSGGHIRIDSEVGNGTTVRIFLPRRQEAETSTDPQPASPEPATSGNGEVILVVEDDPEVLEIALGMLRGLGYAVLVAHDAPEALIVLEGTRRIDLLFTDVVMPHGMNGAELARRALELRPSLPVLLTSGYTARALSQDHGVQGEFPLLRKPYRVAEMGRAVRNALGARSPASTVRADIVQAGPLRVFVVEDHMLVRLSAVTLLQESGFEVVGDTADGESALVRIAKLDGNVDVLFTDVALPGMDGRALAAEARRQYPHLKVVLATGYSRDPGQSDDDGMIRLSKPFHSGDVQRLRTQLLAN